MSASSFVIPPPPQAAIAVAGESKAFPVRRIWCVGRNYLEHIREMGNDERAPPFFFAKHPDMRMRYFGPATPTSTTVQISRLADPNAMIEIEAIAVIDD